MWRKSSGVASRSNFCLQGGLGEKGNVPGFSWTIHHPKGSVFFLCYFNQSEEQDVV